MGPMAELDAKYFDGWYADLSASATQQRIQQEALGLPSRLQSSSLLSWGGLDEVVRALDVTVGHTLLDLACGRGGYGLEVAARTGADLIGVDFSAVAVAQAERNVHAFELSGRARFVLGDLVATGVADRSVDAIMCVDAIQFATPLRAAAQEFRRVIRPGGRIALTSWQPVDRDDDRLPSRLSRLDPEPDLVDAGFLDVVVADRPEWRRAERAMWQAALAVGPTDDPAMQSMQDEAERVLAVFELMRRVLITATAPA
jgi:SAM-dependent methyltransferase